MKRIDIAILGYGVVGSGVAQAWMTNRQSIAKKTGCDFNLKKILDIRSFPGDPLAHLFTKNSDDIFEDPDISVVAETIGGTSVAYEYTKKALLSGKCVVTSNKELLAAHGPELLKIAKEKEVSYLFEASVGGGIPIIRTMQTSLTGDVVQGITGIMNGTTNYILTKMFDENIGFEDALGEAQSLGYAEQNPVSDVEGTDAARKLAILCAVATGRYLDYRNIYTEGITDITSDDIEYAKEAGYSIKLIARARDLNENLPGAIVAPMFLSADSPLCNVNDVYNGIMIDSNILGTSMYYGHGAGKLPTASAVMADIIEAGLNKNPKWGRFIWESNNLDLVDHKKSKVSAFIRLKNIPEADKLLDELIGKTDVSELNRRNDNERAYIVGKEKPLTEGFLSESVVKSGICLSFIRVLG